MCDLSIWLRNIRRVATPGSILPRPKTSHPDIAVKGINTLAIRPIVPLEHRFYTSRTITVRPPAFLAFPHLASLDICPRRTKR